MSELNRIWIFNHYASSDYVDKGGRHYWFAKYLRQAGYFPVVFCCNKIHNTDRFCFENNEIVNETMDEMIGVPFVFLRGRNYRGNGKDRILNMLDFYWNMKKIAGEYAKKNGKPDIIYASSVHPLTLVAGIQLARKFGVKCVCEMRDLWPENIVSVGLASRNNPVIKGLYMLERWVLKRCDAIITTMEGGYDYIVERGYTDFVSKDKFYYINNGIDIEEFDKNVSVNIVKDRDLERENTFKVLYTGSLRMANGLEQLLGCAKKLRSYKEIQFLVYGGGESINELESRIKRDNLDNVHLKGRVEKKYIPYILSKGNVNMLNYNTVATAGLYKYGSSQNKLFEYLASGRPIISNTEIGYDIIKKYQCGISRNMWDDESYAKALLELYQCSGEKYESMCRNARNAAYDFDFKQHTQKLIEIFQKTMKKEKERANV